MSARARRFNAWSTADYGLISTRLADRSYGRFLRRIVIRAEARNAELEAVCDRRRIVIAYRLYDLGHAKLRSRNRGGIGIDDPELTYLYEPSDRGGEATV